MSKDILTDLIAIAREWSDFTREDGTGHKPYCNEFVNCYHADGNDHSSIRFGNYPHQMEISLFNPVKIAGTVQAHKHICQTIREASALLASARRAKAERSDEEKETDKQRRIEKLKTELEALSA